MQPRYGWKNSDLTESLDVVFETTSKTIRTSLGRLSPTSQVANRVAAVALCPSSNSLIRRRSFRNEELNGSFGSSIDHSPPPSSPPSPQASRFAGPPHFASA